MSIFRSIVFSAVATGLFVGLVITAVQHIGTVPLILKAEVHERAAESPSPAATTGETTRKGRNLAADDRCVVATGNLTLPSMDLIVEGRARSLDDPADVQRLEAQLRVVDRAADPASGVATAARFVVEAARPGAQPA